MTPWGQFWRFYPSVLYSNPTESPFGMLPMLELPSNYRTHDDPLFVPLIVGTTPECRRLELAQPRDLIGYGCTRNGEIWSRKTSKRWRRIQGKRDKRGKDRRGITFSAPDGKCTGTTMARLIAIAWLGIPKNGEHVLHKTPPVMVNGVWIWDDSMGNLKFGTPQDNADDRINDGNAPFGELVTGAKLTEEQVVEIIKAIASGESQMSQSRKYGISQAVVNNIWLGRRWKHINREQIISNYNQTHPARKSHSS
jgi:hypothetical protein